MVTVGVSLSMIISLFRVPTRKIKATDAHLAISQASLAVAVTPRHREDNSVFREESAMNPSPRLGRDLAVLACAAAVATSSCSPARAPPGDPWRGARKRMVERQHVCRLSGA